MGRYLLFFSYIGTHFRGMQIQREAGEVVTKIKTVQGLLEENLRKLKPVNMVAVKTSSRTDSSVHALCNTCHVDLIHKHHPKREFNPQWITARLNKSLTRNGERLRIHNTLRVPDDFVSRLEATERSYVYHLAVVKKKNVYTEPGGRGLPWSAHDSEFCTRVYPPFDVDLFLKAAETLTGRHNFKSFSTKNLLKTGRIVRGDAEMSIQVQRGSAMMEEHREGVSDIINHWEVHFQGKSFLYRQVRRMMGAMVMVAKGRMTLDKLQHLLDNPSLYNPGQIEALPGYGLTLKQVRYPDHVFNFSQLYTAGPESTQDSLQDQTEISDDDDDDDDDKGEEPRFLLKETVPVPPWLVSSSTNTRLESAKACEDHAEDSDNTDSELIDENKVGALNSTSDADSIRILPDSAVTNSESECVGLNSTVGADGVGIGTDSTNTNSELNNRSDFGVVNSTSEMDSSSAVGHLDESCVPNLKNCDVKHHECTESGSQHFRAALERREANGSLDDLQNEFPAAEDNTENTMKLTENQEAKRVASSGSSRS